MNPTDFGSDTALTHICMIVQNYYQVDPRVRRKADSLVAHGYEVDVIALREAGRAHVYRQDGVTVYTVPLAKKRAGRLRYVYEYLAFWVLACMVLVRLCLEKRYAIVDVNTLPDFLVFAAFPARWLGAKLILDMHEIMPEFYMSKFGVPENHWLIRLLIRLERWSYRFADYVIASNDLLAERFVARGLSPERLIVVMNSADEKVFEAAQNTPSRNPTGNTTPIVLMYHGTLTHIYGLDIALEALAQVQVLRPDLALEFHILGTGPALDNLRTLAQRLGLDEKIKFIGSVPLDQVPQYLAQCDAGLLPTRRDVFLELSFSNKLVEYIVMGKPVIAANLQGYQRYFGAHSLVFFEAGDVTALAQALIRFADNRGMWEDLVVQARQDYESISWQVMERRYLDVLEALLAETQ